MSDYNVKIGKIYEIVSLADSSGLIRARTFMVRVEKDRWIDCSCEGTTVVMLSLPSNGGFYKALFNDGFIGEFYIASYRFREVR